MSLTDLL